MTGLWPRRRRRRIGIVALGLGLLAGLLSFGGPVARAQSVELELVLALDASSSVSRREFDFQAQGLAEAFRHPEVRRAIAALGGGGLAVTVFQWSGPGRQSVAVPWRRIADAAGAQDLAGALAAMPRYVTGGGTAIGPALAFGQDLFAESPFKGARRAIDISGDGRANMGGAPQPVRDRLAAAGVTVNALAILNEERALDRYYAETVIGGPGAFLMTAADYTVFAEAIRRKLAREIAGAGMVRRQPGASGQGDRPRAKAAAGQAEASRLPEAPTAGGFDDDLVAGGEVAAVGGAERLFGAVGAQDMVAPAGAGLAAVEAEGRHLAAVGEDRDGHRLAEFQAAHGAVAAPVRALAAGATPDAKGAQEHREAPL